MLSRIIVNKRRQLLKRIIIWVKSNAKKQNLIYELIATVSKHIRKHKKNIIKPFIRISGYKKSIRKSFIHIRKYEKCIMHYKNRIIL